MDNESGPKLYVVDDTLFSSNERVLPFPTRSTMKLTAYSLLDGSKLDNVVLAVPYYSIFVTTKPGCFILRDVEGIGGRYISDYFINNRKELLRIFKPFEDAQLFAEWVTDDVVFAPRSLANNLFDMFTLEHIPGCIDFVDHADALQLYKAVHNNKNLQKKFFRAYKLLSNHVIYTKLNAFIPLHKR